MENFKLRSAELWYEAIVDSSTMLHGKLASFVRLALNLACHEVYD